MKELLAQVSSRFDYVVIDAPPALPVTDPAVIGAQVDGVVLCIGAGMVNREDLKSCDRRLRNSGVHVLGAVLNHFHVTAGAYRYRPYDPAYARDLPEEPADGGAERRSA